MNLKKLPSTYVSFMRLNKPKSGYTHFKMAGHFDLEPLFSIGQLNEDIEIANNVEVFTVFICTDGEALVFNNQGEIFSLSLIGMFVKRDVFSVSLGVNSWNTWRPMPGKPMQPAVPGLCSTGRGSVAADLNSDA